VVEVVGSPVVEVVGSPVVEVVGSPVVEVVGSPVVVVGSPVVVVGSPVVVVGSPDVVVLGSPVVELLGSPVVPEAPLEELPVSPESRPPELGPFESKGDSGSVVLSQATPPRQRATREGAKMKFEPRITRSNCHARRPALNRGEAFTALASQSRPIGAPRQSPEL
jgi:hypothetical protein